MAPLGRLLPGGLSYPAAGGAAGGAAVGGMLGQAFDLPRQAVNSAIMRLADLGGVSPLSGGGQMTGRDLSGYAAGLGGMAGGNPLAAAGLAAGPGAMPYTMPTSPQDVPFPEQAQQSREGSLLPALLGLGAGAISAFTPLAPFAVPIGAAVGGLSQALFNRYDPESYGSFSTQDVLQRTGLPDDPMSQMAAAYLTDPMSYAGLQAGAFAGNRAAQLAGGLGESSAAGRLGEFAAQARAGGSLERAGEFAGLGRTVGVGEPSAARAIDRAVLETSGPPDVARYLNAGAEPAMPANLRQIMAERQAVPLSEMFPYPLNGTGPAAGGAGSVFEQVPFNEALMTGAPAPGFSGGVTYGPGAGGGAAMGAVSHGAATNPDLLAAQLPGFSAAGATGVVPPPAPAQGTLQGLLMGQGSAAAAPAGPPMQLPFDAGAGLAGGYGAGALGNVPQMPLGTPAYKMVRPEVRAILAELGVPPEMFARGGLPPWAQVRGGRVGMAPGVLPEDVLRGARAAAGY